LYKQARSLSCSGKVFRTPHLWRARTLYLRIPLSRLESGLQLQKAYLGQKSKGDTSEIMSALLQFSNVRFAVIRLSSAKGSPERLVLAYPNEETLRGLIADTSIIGLGFSSQDEAACAGAAVTNGATLCQADGVSGSHAEERLGSCRIFHLLFEKHRVRHSPGGPCRFRVITLCVSRAKSAEMNMNDDRSVRRTHIS
jgi:hypothetical protein